MFSFKIKKKPYYITNFGKAFHCNSMELMTQIPDDSLDLILTSPPFALTSKKEYGNKQEDEYIDWFLNFSMEFKRILKPDGSFVVDLGGAYLPGHPIRSIYQYELLVKLVKEQEFFFGTGIFSLQSCKTSCPRSMGQC